MSKVARSSALFQEWIEAADEWKRLRSDPAEARVRAARAALYLAVFGEVPALPRPTPKTEKPIASGDRVRIIEHSQMAYPPPFRGLTGITAGVTVTRATKVRRWLVDYGEHHSGRLNVREEHLERVTDITESPIAS